MERIGVAASKISKGNLMLYNAYVVAISCLFSLFIFVVAGSTIIFALTIITYVSNEIMSYAFEDVWPYVTLVCMITLTILMTLFNLIAISKNIRISKIKKDSHQSHE